MARKGKNTAKEAFWRDVLRRHAKSGLTIRAFCRRHELGENLFYWWRRELARRDRQETTTKSESPQGHALEEQGSIASFIPVQVIAAGALELTHPRGCRISIPDGFRAATLRQVLAVLDEVQE
jgi:transposase-like protein